jgi:hypothetical protein
VWHAPLLKKLNKIPFLLFFLVLALGCQSAPRKMNAVQLGMPRKEVVLLLGTPAKTHRQDNREVLQFDLHQSLDDPYAPDESYWVFIEDNKVVQHGRERDFKSSSPPPREELAADIKVV